MANDDLQTEPDVPIFTGWRRGFALAAGALALIHGGVTVFDEQHNGGAGTSIVLAMVMVGAVITQRPSAPTLSVGLALVIAGRTVVRAYLGQGFDGLGLIVALMAAGAGVALWRRPSP